MSDDASRTSRWPAHPFLFAAFPVVYLMAQNLAETDILDVVPALVVSIGATASLFLVGSWILKDARRAALAVSGLVLLFFSYGYFHRALLGTPLGRHRVLLPLWAVLALGLLTLVSRSRVRLSGITNALNFMAAALVLLNLLPIVAYNVREGGGAPASRAADPVLGAARGPRRDIYYLVFDRYGGPKALAGRWRFDNSDFLDELRARGFYVADRSTGNYPRTLHSLASSLNMEHLLELARVVGEDSSNGRPLRELVKNHLVGRGLKSRGYSYTHIGSWWRTTASSPIADVNLRTDGLSEFSNVLLETTAAAPLASLISERFDPRRRHYDRGNRQWDHLMSVSRRRGPKFVFAHFISPHTPYVVNRDGSFVTEPVLNRRTERESYIEQLLYVNSRLNRFLDEVLQGPEDQRPIVILQSDEGPGERPRSWTRASRGALQTKLFILNAYYLPGVSDPGLYPTITPVNSFRKVFNLYFGSAFSPLPDRVYVFRDTDHPYEFIDVTARLGREDP